MFMSDITKKDEVRGLILQDLQKYNIKFRLPKKKKVNTTMKNKCFFKVALDQLPMETVTLRTGRQISLPTIVHELCLFILQNVEVEGLFRKEGSKARQSEIKLLLNSGNSINGDEHAYSPVEVAAVLKSFVRDLPDPLIPFAYHDLFLRCMLLKTNRLETILLACLLLPNVHLNTLSYLMQFFNEVASYSQFNKMTSNNLAICIGPTAFPVEDKVAPDPKLRTTKTCELFKLLIDNASQIGVIPERIIDGLNTDNGNPDLNSDNMRKKKRRSGSLTRIFNGLKKIVSSKNDEDVITVTPDLLLTPITGSPSRRKRKVDSNRGTSTQKRRNVMQILPENNLLTMPFVSSPVFMNISGGNDGIENPFYHKLPMHRWPLRSMSCKSVYPQMDKPKSKTTSTLLSNIDTKQSDHKTNVVERNTSVSCSALPKRTTGKDPEFVYVPKEEYEDIKTRVCNIERRISVEFDQCKSNVKTTAAPIASNEQNIRNVQNAYEQTLTQQSKLSPTTDKIAKRLSRELKVRNNVGEINRSPSARRIHSMKRRSMDTPTGQSVTSKRSSSPAKGSLKRGRPNTLQSGLPQTTNQRRSLGSLKTDDEWVSADGYFARAHKINQLNVNTRNDRASIALLRRENAGMVQNRAKLFENTISSGIQPKNRYDNTSSITQKVLRLRNDETSRVTKSTTSPHKKSSSDMSLNRKQKHIVQQCETIGGLNTFCSPISVCTSGNPFADEQNFKTPLIKKTPNIRTKKIIKTPNRHRATPLKALAPFS